MAAITAPVATRRPLILAGKWKTPALLWRSLWALWILDVLLLFALLYAGHVHHSALKTIGQDSAPSIIAAQQIKSSLADMDANAANELLADPRTAAAATQAYVQRRQQAATALIAAAQNITYGDAERVPILKIQLALGRYEALIQRARDLREERNPAFISAYNQAAQVLDTTILPAADALDTANLRELERSYKNQRTASLIARSLVLLAGGALLILLIAIQRFLFIRTRRVFNVPLLAASILLCGYVGYTLHNLDLAERNLKRAREDAFTSVHALWRAWAVAYAANSDESRFLLDPNNAAQHTADFVGKRDALAKLPAGESYDSLLKIGGKPQLSGYLADELNNITFRGEQEAAEDTVHAFARYLAIDGEIRNLEAQGKHNEAVALCTGTAPGQSDWAFEQFGRALKQTLDINQQAFDDSIRSGLGELGLIDVKSSVMASVFALLCLGGLLQRIREYR